jgi:hypothetical protein
MCLQASYELELIDPKINIRVDKDTPDEIFELGFQLTKKGLGFPQYSNDDIIIPGLIRDYALIRLAEVYYTLAECKFRAGDKEGAAKLLNVVRKRYYPEEKYTEYLYKPEGAVELTEAELLYEWGA